MSHFFILPSKVCPGQVLLDWQVNQFTNQRAIIPALTMQPPISLPSPHLRALSSVAIKMIPCMRTIAFTDDFRGTNFAQQPKQLKNPLFQINEKNLCFQINVLTCFQPGIAESQGRCISYFEITPFTLELHHTAAHKSLSTLYEAHSSLPFQRQNP